MSVNIALLTVTDTRTLETDKSGNILQEKIKKANHNLIERKICKDNKKDIKKIINNWLKKKKIDIIITTGGTGLTGRDITPEALNEIADKLNVPVALKRRIIPISKATSPILVVTKAFLAASAAERFS